MFGLKKSPEFPPFQHGDGCRIIKADPSTVIEWNEISRGYWEAVCTCGKQWHQEPQARSARLDPLDPANARHAPQCEFVSETDSAKIKLLLKISERDSYWWVECGSCEFNWQVPFYPRPIKLMADPKR